MSEVLHLVVKRLAELGSFSNRHVNKAYADIMRAVHPDHGSEAARSSDYIAALQQVKPALHLLATSGFDFAALDKYGPVMMAVALARVGLFGGHGKFGRRDESVDESYDPPSFVIIALPDGVVRAVLLSECSVAGDPHAVAVPGRFVTSSRPPRDWAAAAAADGELVGASQARVAACGLLCCECLS